MPQQIDPNAIQWDAPPAQSSPPSRPRSNVRVIGGTPPAERRAQEDQQLERQKFQQQQINQANSQAIQAESLRLKQAEESRKQADFEAKQEKEAEKERKRQRGQNDVVSSLKKVLRELDAIEKDAKDANGWFETGTSGQLARALPGSNPGKDLAANVQTVQASFAFDALQKIRDNSTTGAALGPVTDKDLELLKSSVANISPDLSQETFLKNINRARQLYLEQLQKYDPKAAAAFDERSGDDDTELVTGFDRADRFFGGNDWVEQQIEAKLKADGYTPVRMARITQQLNARSGDQSFSADDVLAIYRQAGIDLVPSNEAAQEAAARVRAGGQFSEGVDVDELREFFSNQLAEEVQSREDVEGAPGFFDLAKSGITLGLSDEAAGVGEVIGSALTGDLNVAENFSRGQAVELARRDQAREEMGGLGIAAELLGAGGGVRVLDGTTQALRAASGVWRSGRPVTRSNVQNALTQRATAEGAGIGALAGAAEGTSLEDRGTNALIGAALGGTLGVGGQMLGNRMANRSRNALAEPQSGNPTGAQALQAADDLNIEVIPAVTGGRLTQAATAASRQSLVADLPIESSVSRMHSQAQAAREQAASLAGEVLDNEDAGNLVRRGAEIYSKRTSAIGGKLYDRAHARAGDVQLPMTGAIKAIDDELEALAKSAQGVDSTLYKDLSKLRDQMSARSFDVQGIGATKTNIRNEITMRGLRGSPQDRIYMKVLDAAENDLITGLEKVGKREAAQALKTARAFWKNRVETIDQVLDPILGKTTQRSGEQIMSALERLGNPNTGDGSKLRRLIAALPEKEARAVIATAINRLGRPTAGSSQNQAGFSFNTFLTNWNNLSPRARATLFPKESLDALNKLATISRRVKEAANLENTSNTGRAATALVQVSWFATEPFTAGGAMAGQYAIGKLLASPEFARLLARAPKQNTPQARQSLGRQVGNLAQAEPSIARELNIYRQAINDNAISRVAASESQPEQDKPPLPPPE